MILEILISAVISTQKNRRLMINKRNIENEISDGISELVDPPTDEI